MSFGEKNVTMGRIKKGKCKRKRKNGGRKSKKGERK
jgi:hypothetical protein